MADAQVFVFLLVAIALLAALADRARVPYPVALVLGGLGLGLVPGLPAPEIEPDVVFFVFLPALLYAAAFSASAYELRENARPIGLLAVGLVLLTVAGVAAAAHWLLGLPWVAAFVLGAVLGPTDPVSATAIIRRVGAPDRIATILEGESLVNDGTGLTAYNLAVAAAGAAALSLWASAGKFVLVAIGGIAVGIAVGWLVTRLRTATRVEGLELTLSLLTPFAAYVPAEELGVSGVLAVVTAGLIVGHRSLELTGAETRLQTLSFWRATSFLLNSLLFLLIGLQLPSIVDRVSDADVIGLASQGLLVAVVVMALRMAWMIVVPAIYSAPFTPLAPSETGPRERVLLGWSGMRGGVSLAAALAIPDSVPQRDTLVVVAYGAVLLTLVVPSVTLAPLVRRLGIGEGEDQQREEAEVRARLARAALDRVEALTAEDEHPGRAAGIVRARYEARLERAEAESDDQAESSGEAHAAEELAVEAVEAQRELLRELRRERAAPAATLRELERELDLEESRMRG
jgi:Na+/H+ antiporter